MFLLFCLVAVLKCYLSIMLCCHVKALIMILHYTLHVEWDILRLSNICLVKELALKFGKFAFCISVIYNMLYYFYSNHKEGPPLSCAAANGHQVLVLYLLSSGASLTGDCTMHDVDVSMHLY